MRILLPAVVKLCIILLGSMAPAVLSATDLPEISDPVIQSCIDKMMPVNSLTQQIALRSYDDSGLIEESIASLYWRRAEGDKSRAVMRLSEPASRKGLAVLMVENDSAEPKMYLYVPDLKKTRRVTGRQLAASMMGTDFSYEEFSHFQRTASKSETRRAEDQIVDGTVTYVLETIPAGDGSAYSRILTFVDQTRCVPLQTQFFALNGDLSKELLATPDEIKQIGDRHIPHKVVMHDRLNQTRTELIVENVELDVELNDGVFSPKRLGMIP